MGNTVESIPTENLIREVKARGEQPFGAASYDPLAAALVDAVEAYIGKSAEKWLMAGIESGYVYRDPVNGDIVVFSTNPEHDIITPECEAAVEAAVVVETERVFDFDCLCHLCIEATLGEATAENLDAAMEYAGARWFLSLGKTEENAKWSEVIDALGEYAADNGLSEDE